MNFCHPLSPSPLPITRDSGVIKLCRCNQPDRNKLPGEETENPKGTRPMKTSTLCG